MQLVKRIEGDACRKSDLILACSENEKRELMDIYRVAADKIIVITNGALYRDEIALLEKISKRPEFGLTVDDKVVLFIGAYYKPNIDAAQSIVSVIAPQLKDFTFLIAGSVQEAFRRSNLPKNVHFLGQLSQERMHSALSISDIAINPMFAGSGINIKMLDYMAYGLPIVTTECGFRGINAEGMHPALITPVEGFAENIRKLMNDKQLSAIMGKDGRSLVRRSYDWKSLSSKLQDAILGRQHIK